MVLKYQTIYSELPVQAYMIQMVKKPLLESIQALFDGNASKTSKLRAVAKLWRALQAVRHLPEPTIENTWHPNSHNLIKIRDGLLKQTRLDPIRVSFIKNVLNLAIIVYDFDPPWRWIMDSAKDEAFSMDWKPRGYGDDWSDGYNWWRE